MTREEKKIVEEKEITYCHECDYFRDHTDNQDKEEKSVCELEGKFVNRHDSDCPCWAQTIKDEV